MSAGSAIGHCRFPSFPHSEPVKEIGVKAAQRSCVLRDAPAGAPQHEGMPSMALGKVLILRKPRSGCLEGRTALIPLISILSPARKRESRMATPQRMLLDPRFRGDHDDRV